MGAVLVCASGLASAEPVLLPTGQSITPLTAPGAQYEPLIAHVGPRPETLADGAAAIAMSPDKREMLILTSGFNRVNGPDGAVMPAQSTQYVMRYTIAVNGARWQQTVQVPNSYSGIVWAPNGRSFYVGGGVDDTVLRFDRKGATFAEARTRIKLGHKVGNGADVLPQAAGVSVSPDGKRLLVANYYNDSVSLIDLASGTIVAEQDLRPGKIDPAKSGVPGGEFPYAVLWGDSSHAYVSAPRDREIVALDIASARISIAKRVKLRGEPTALLLDPMRARLYATQDNSDRLAIIETGLNTLLAEPVLSLPGGIVAEPLGRGTNPNSLALTPDHNLLVTYGGINALALVKPADGETRVIGLMPTGWYPSAVATSADGKRVFVVNRKSPPGPNLLGCSTKRATVKGQPQACGAANQYIFQLEKAGLLQFRMPSPTGLVALTDQVADNIGLHLTAQREAAENTMALLHQRIKHVVYIVKENRTYDQVLGDMERGNGDPHLAILGKRYAPNHQSLARQFVLLDNFYDSGEQSSTGWTWTTAARVPDLLEKTAPVNYSARGLAYEAEQADRNVPAELSREQRRRVSPEIPDDADLLPGKALLTAPDGDGDDDTTDGQGFIWNAALNAGLTLRNYGFGDASVYDTGKPGDVAPVRDPYKERRKVFVSGASVLAPYSDPYFRGFDQRLPDYWRVLEWQREFAEQAATNSMPALTLLRLSHDHFGDFETAIDKVDTVETQMADNDYALGMVMQTLSQSRFASSTLIFVIEDDAQNGADHVDARRSIALVLGAYVKRNALISTRYTTISMLRTIEAVLGLKPIGLNDALALPMADLFDFAAPASWTFHAAPAQVLRSTDLPIPNSAYPKLSAMTDGCPARSASWWAAAMEGQDFTAQDRLDTDRFNKALWRGLGHGPLPADRSGADLRTGRAELVVGDAVDAHCELGAR